VKSDQSSFVKESKGLKAKYDLFDICFEKMIVHIGNVSEEDDSSAQLLKEIHKGTK